MVAFAISGTSLGRQIYLLELAGEKMRPYFLSTTSLVATIAGVLIAFFYGLVAHVHGSGWPLLLIASLNLMAFLVTLMLPSTASFSPTPRDLSATGGSPGDELDSN